jgi:hypothetical protein
MTTIIETCSCGATFRYVGSHPRSAADEWRRGHKHAESVGICGNRLTAPAGFPAGPTAPYCALKAGHAGMHGDGDGAHWGNTSPAPGCDLACCRIALDCLTSHATDTDAEETDRA